MVNRVILNTAGLKISKPGIDVLSAGNSGLLFTSDATQMRAWMVGSVFVPANQTVRVSYGKAFPSYPMVDMTMLQSGTINYFLDSAWLLPSTTTSYMDLAGGSVDTTFQYTVWDTYT